MLTREQCIQLLIFSCLAKFSECSHCILLEPNMLSRSNRLHFKQERPLKLFAHALVISATLSTSGLQPWSDEKWSQLSFLRRHISVGIRLCLELSWTSPILIRILPKRGPLHEPNFLTMDPWVWPAHKHVHNGPPLKHACQDYEQPKIGTFLAFHQVIFLNMKQNINVISLKR